MQKASTFRVPLVSLLLLVASSFSLATTITITPTTTLQAQTGNNTSAASTFTATTNGDAGASNISKLSVHQQMYPGSTTKIFARLMPWWGTSSHMNIGYDSADPAQIHKQVTDMMSRGIDGTILDWYGPDKVHHNTVALNLMAEAELHPGFVFSVTEDKGALSTCASTAGCDVTLRLITDLNYAWNTFEQSPAYFRKNGHPVVFFFGTEAYTIDWNKVRANVLGSPYFVFRNSGGFTKTQSNGGFSWVGISTSTTDMGLSYLDNFYSTAVAAKAPITVASGYKGFNDTLASWGKNRIVSQQCGQTYLATMAEVGKYYSASNELEFLQLVTWNDYEEGTEIETGISNCVSISANVSSGNLTWTTTGQQNTLDHYTVYISTDGQNLMPLTEAAIGANSLNLSSYSLAAGTYTLYVQAGGKPMMLNHMSNAVTYTAAAQVVPAPVVPAGNVSITSPSASSTVTKSFTVKASIKTTLATDAVAVYVDGIRYSKTAYNSTSISFSQALSVSGGSHKLTVQAWDTAGNIYKQSIYVTAK